LDYITHISCSYWRRDSRVPRACISAEDHSRAQVRTASAK
jgi:hypothetical protein